MPTTRIAAITTTALFVLAAMAGCKRAPDHNATGDTVIRSADTSVVTRKVQDTMVVHHDTTVRVDTTMVGRGTKGADTSHKH